MGTIFSIARKRPALTSNVPDLGEFKPTKLPVASRVLDKEEIKEMITYFKAMQLHEFGDMCILALDLGLHISEVNVMRVEHIEGLDTKSPRVHIQGTKTAARKAKLPMTKRAVDAAKRRIAAVGRGELFPTYINNKLRVERTWDRFRTHMGMTEDNCFTFKILRHTCGSTLADTKVDAFKIRDFMRHASIATTERNYIHTAKHRLRDASDSLEDHSEL